MGSAQFHLAASQQTGPFGASVGAVLITAIVTLGSFGITISGIIVWLAFRWARLETTVRAMEVRFSEERVDWEGFRAKVLRDLSRIQKRVYRIQTRK